MSLPDGAWLNVGSGSSAAPGWRHLDGSWRAYFSRRPLLSRVGALLVGREVGGWPDGVEHWNAKRPLPAAAESVAVVYASHFVEHLYRDQAVEFLRDVRRILKAGGVCRLVVPDVAAAVGWYLDHRRSAPSNGPPSSDLLMELLGVHRRSPPSGGLLNAYRAWTDFDRHKWMYDAEGVVSLMEEAGFQSPEIREYLDSAIPEVRLADVERADRVLEGAGVCAEARK